MTDVLIRYAHQFISTHSDIEDATEPYEKNGLTYIDAVVKINLPAQFKKRGRSNKGVKDKEEVKFEFLPSFPYEAPKIYLRTSFKRNFAHINPITSKVNPCVYYGSNDELMLQPKWITSLIDQTVDWLQKAASDSMIDYTQGWEPIRVDDNYGYIIFDRNKLLENKYKLIEDDRTEFPPIVIYEESKNSTFSAVIKKFDKDLEFHESLDLSYLLCFSSTKTSDTYMPYQINNYAELLKFAQENNINDIENYSMHNINKEIKYIFISLFIQRPCNLISNEDDIEILNFIVENRKHQKNDELIHKNAKVYILGNKYTSNKEILKQFAGVNKVINTADNIKGITQIGCGSLGSKIIMHLGRNGNDNITLFDKHMFSPNNNARHALFANSTIYAKSKIMEMALKELGLETVEKHIDDVIDLQEKLENIEDNIIIDSTASLSVYNFLSNISLKSRLIKTTLYNNATIGVLFIEGENRKVKIIDLFTYLNYLCVLNPSLAKKMNDSNTSYQNVGQGCGSFTTVCTDADISIFAATMSTIVQSKISNGLDISGQLHIGIKDESLSTNWESVNIEEVDVLRTKDIYDENWEVRVFPEVKEKMKAENTKYSPDETGGILIGHISMTLKTFVVVDIIIDVKGSYRSPTKFITGIEGLKEKIKQIEKLSVENLTLLGTWHTHPEGGGPSVRDLKTKREMLEQRDGLPLVNIIYTETGLIAF